MKERGSGG
jgi:hypothetical protein